MMKTPGWLFYPLCLLLVVCFLLLISQNDPPSSTTIPSIPADAVQRAPSIDAGLIEQVLQAADSPARGMAHDLYTLGVQYQIDPAMALAFFHHESDYGRTGVARLTKSLGNIRCTDGYRCIDGYRAYPSWQAGAEDWYRLLHTVYVPRGLTTVETIIPVYAPAADHNNERAYSTSVLTDVERWRKGQV